MMKRRFSAAYKWAIGFSLALVVFSACDPCDDCDTVSSEPTIELVFINGDSLAILDSMIAVNTSSSDLLASEIATLNDTLAFLADSLTTITDSIANGGSLADAQASIEEAIQSFDQQRTTKSDEKVVFDEMIADMNSIRNVINSGLVLVDQIEVVETGNLLVFTDSATSYRLPLSFDQSFRQYAVTIGSNVNTIEVDYNLFQELDDERNVLTRARDIIISNHSFDSLNACTTNCFDGEATFTFYF